jgi:hypothetical protein
MVGYFRYSGAIHNRQFHYLSNGIFGFNTPICSIEGRAYVSQCEVNVNVGVVFMKP